MRKQEPIYADLDLNMVAHPLTGDLVPRHNIEAVRQSIRNIFFLEAFDFPFDGDRESSLRKLLFEPANQLTESRIKNNLKWIITKTEPRVELERIDVEETSDFTGYNITIWYSIKSIMVQDNFTFYAKKVR